MTRAPSKDSQFEQKERFFQQKLLKNPLDTIVLSRLGKLYLSKARETARHQDYAKAGQTYARILQSQPDNPTALIGFSYALIGRHRFVEALPSAKKAGEQNPNDPTGWTLLGDLYFALGDYLEAEMFYFRLFQHKKNRASLARMAQISDLRGDYQRAVSFYEQALNENHSRHAEQAAWCETMLADVLLKSGRTQAAKNRWRKIAGDTPSRRYASARQAEIALFEGHPAEALNLAESLIQKDKTTPGYLFLNGRIEQALGREEKAREHFQRARRQIREEMGQGETGHIRELIKHLLDQHTQLDNALKLARLDLESRHDVEAYELLAWALYLNGSHQQAAEAMGVALQPGLPDRTGLLRAAQIYFKADQPFRAGSLLEIGLKRGEVVAPDLLAQARELKIYFGSHPELIRDRFMVRKVAAPKEKQAKGAAKE